VATGRGVDSNAELVTLGQVGGGINTNASDNGEALDFNPPAPVLAADEGHLVRLLRQASLKIVGERLAVSAWIDELLLLAGQNGKLGCPDMNEG
jgi:hypothetical protein